MRRVLFVLCLAAAATAAAQTTTVTAQTTNNTAACAAANAPAYCKGAFAGLSDSTSGTYDAKPGNVSTVKVQSLLYPGNTTKVFAYFVPWFCMQAGSTATGVGTSCQSHLQVGYNSDDSGTVAGQMDDMVRRGFDGIAVDWYGPTLNFYNNVTLKVRDNAENRCGTAQACPLFTALVYDQGSFEWGDGAGFAGCPQNGGGVSVSTQTYCILNKMESDLKYAYNNYFNTSVNGTLTPTKSYLRVDTVPGSLTYMQPSTSGKPAVLFFICEECWTNPSPDWQTIWNSLRSYTNSNFTAGGSSGVAMFFIFRNAPAFSHVQTNGGYAWVNWDNSNGTDLYGLNYLASFYNTATSAFTANPALITFGGAWKGYDETNAPWVSGTPRIMDQQCGNTWLQTIESANSHYSGSKQLPFIGLATWNDYEEGTEIEAGIDNCLTVSASLSGSVLSWTPKFSKTTGSENTVSSYVVYSSTDGTNLTRLTTLGTGTHTLDLSTFSLANGTYTISVQAVGQPSILNKISNSVTYTVGAATARGSIAGKVTTSSGTAVRNATVTITGGVVATTVTTTTTGSGKYNASSIPVGTYTVTVSASGYATQSQTTTVSAGQTTTLNFTMH